MQVPDFIAITEAEQLLGDRFGEAHRGMFRDLAESFATPEASGEISIKVALAVWILMGFGLHQVFVPQNQVAIAVEAASGARPGGGRALVVAMNTDKPVPCWVEELDPERPKGRRVVHPGAPARYMMLSIPADSMLDDLLYELGRLRQPPARAEMA
jgi:hypothetical protein